ncbi:hypothetical protein M407DRAFT_9820 [Tulasnella calospora MUT 4182]|uniref:Rho-GAP domain-containing protein n=1 Tax=Tulasnella calospora MUT 4182 TaxID=1051891 RepID=A0A0C3Q2J7_9AGAM|nr:hypothetical protein M407DRAFT_9820 [Tulasnella calospora MUT 4182]
MQLSSYISFLQLWLMTLLRKLPASVQQLHQLAAATTSTPPPLPYEGEPDGPINFEKPHNNERYPDMKTSGFPKPLVYTFRVFYEEILALVNGPLPAWSLAISRFVFGPTSARTHFGSTASATSELHADLTPLKDGTPTLQPSHAVLAWLVRFYLPSVPPQPNTEIVVPTSIARRLVRE